MEQPQSKDSFPLKIVCGNVPEFSRVELPCFVKNVDTALQCLGGKDAVRDGIKDAEGALQFTYPSANDNQTKVIASVVNKNGLLLKIRRKRSPDGSQSSKATCQVVGTISKSFIFNNLADYEFLPANPLPPKPAVVRSSLGENVAILDTAPHSFSRSSVNKGAQRLVLHESIRKQPTVSRISTSNATTQSSKAVSSTTPINKHTPLEEETMFDAEAKNIQEANSRNPDKGLAYFINIDDPVPDAHPRGEYPYENERGIVLVRLLKKLFSIIPILSREQIETYLNLEGRVHLFKSCLPYVAYNLVKGPFRQLWVRYGYDPKQHPSSALYQTIHFRVSPQVVQDVTDRIGKKVGSSASRSKMVDLDSLRISEMPLNSVTYLLLNRPQQDSPIFTYNHVLKMQLVVQIFQLMDPSILEALSATRMLSTFDSSTGWFPLDSIKNLRVMALQALPERIHRFVSLPDSILWDATLPRALSSKLPLQQSSSSSESEPPAAVSSRAYDSPSLSTMFAASGFNIDEDAAELGFDAQSTGLFVTCNRTLNTLRTYLQCAAAAGPETALTNAASAAGEVLHDEVRTEDGIYLGKVLAWHRRYATTLKGMKTTTVQAAAAKSQASKTSSSASKAKKTRTSTSNLKASKVSKTTKLVSFHGSSASHASAEYGATALALSAALMHAGALGGQGVEAFSHFDDDGADSNSDVDTSDSGGSEEFS